MCVQLVSTLLAARFNTAVGPLGVLIALEELQPELLLTTLEARRDLKIALGVLLQVFALAPATLPLFATSARSFLSWSTFTLTLTAER